MKIILYTITLTAAALFFQSCDNQNKAEHSQTETETTTTETDITGVGGTEATIDSDEIDSGISTSDTINAPIQTPLTP